MSANNNPDPAREQTARVSDRGREHPTGTSKALHGKTILVAAIPASAEVIVDALHNVAHLIVAHSLPIALRRIAYGVDLIVAGTYFDGARMFDLLRAVKVDPSTSDIPIICVRAISAPTTPEAAVRQPIFTNQDVVDSACRALGAVAFLDLCAPPPAQSADAKVELAALARSCLAGGGATVRPA